MPHRATNTPCANEDEQSLRATSQSIYVSTMQTRKAWTRKVIHEVQRMRRKPIPYDPKKTDNPVLLSFSPCALLWLCLAVRSLDTPHSAFGIRISFGFRPSAFGFLPSTLVPPSQQLPLVFADSFTAQHSLIALRRGRQSPGPRNVATVSPRQTPRQSRHDRPPRAKHFSILRWCRSLSGTTCLAHGWPKP